MKIWKTRFSSAWVLKTARLICQYKVNAAWFPKILVKRWLFYETSKIKPTTKIQHNGILYLYIKTVFNNLILMLMNIELNFWLDNPIDYQ